MPENLAIEDAEMHKTNSGFVCESSVYENRREPTSAEVTAEVAVKIGTRKKENSHPNAAEAMLEKQASVVKEACHPIAAAMLENTAITCSYEITGDGTEEAESSREKGHPAQTYVESASLPKAAMVARGRDTEMRLGGGTQSQVEQSRSRSRLRHENEMRLGKQSNKEIGIRPDKIEIRRDEQSKVESEMRLAKK